MIEYEHSLIAMQRLLNAVGETYCADWIQTDIDEWRAKRSTAHHLSGNGGFTDIFICQQNYPSITETQGRWANALFDWLSSFCYYLAHHPNDRLGVGILPNVVGGHDFASSLAGLLGGVSARSSTTGNVAKERQLHGWCCRLCRRFEVSNADIEHLLSKDVVPHLVLQSFDGMSLEKLVDQVLACDVPGIDDVRQLMCRAVVSSGITLTDREPWWKPCPNCGEEDQAVYRWRMTVTEEVRFHPSDDNVPMRN